MTYEFHMYQPITHILLKMDLTISVKHVTKNRSFGSYIFHKN